MSKYHYRPTQIEVNLQSIKDNLSYIINSTGQDRWISPMLKTNAYGHGAYEVAKTIKDMGIDSVGVYQVEEALELRSILKHEQILVYNPFGELGAKTIVENNLTPVVTNWSQLEFLEKYAQKALSVHLKFNTGMNRSGFQIVEFEAVADRMKKSKYLKTQGILSHLSCGEDAVDENGVSAQQAAKMKSIYQFYGANNVIVHLLNSAGTSSLIDVLKGKNTDHYLMQVPWGLRPGLLIYGYDPRGKYTESSLFLKPAMTLQSKLEGIRQVETGGAVSYGQKWVAPRLSWIGLVSIGYADGIHRVASNQSFVLIRGKKIPIVGTICMDLIMLDLTELILDGVSTDDLLKEDVIFFGNQNLTANEWAIFEETIPYEVLTSLSSRIPRTYKDQEK